MRSILLVAAALVVSSVCAQQSGPEGGYNGGTPGFVSAGNSSPGGPPPSTGGNDDNGDDNAPTTTTTTTPTTNSTTATSANSTSSGLTGGKVCVTGGLMCITGIVNGATTTFELEAASSTQPGWMAMGFGAQMAHTPMVILWANSDGSITVSQRMAPAEVMPTVVSNPPRIATVDMSTSNVGASQPTYSFTIPSNGELQQEIIWAFGLTNPQSKAADAMLLEHSQSGPTLIDLSTPITGSNGTIESSNPVLPPLLPYQKLVVGHAIVLTLAFLLLLPSGALFARYLRTASSFWFKGHWIIQFYLAGPVVLTGFILAILAVQEHGTMHFDDTHKLVGLIIVVLYFVQVSLGAFIHFIKNPNRTRRPPQNYMHAILGLTIIGLSLYQVHRGYATEWPVLTGRGPLPNGVNVVWYIWVFLLPILYAAGLAFLPRQFRQEADALDRRQVGGPPSKQLQMQTLRSYSEHPYNNLSNADSNAVLPPAGYRGMNNNNNYNNNGANASFYA